MKWLKYWVLLFFAMTGTSSLASHLLGGSIWYTHIATTSTTSTYWIKLRLTADQSGVTLGTQQYVYAISSDGTINDTLTLNLHTPSSGGFYGGCAYSNIGTYQAVYTFPRGKNMKFYFHQCCRPSGSTAIPSSGSKGFYLEAQIRTSSVNSRGFDNGVVLDRVGATGVRLGRANIIPAKWSEADGDSTHISFRPAAEWLMSAGVPISYATGYSAHQPIPNSGGTDSLHLVASRQALTVIPNTIGQSTIALRYENFLYDALTASYVSVGYSSSEFAVEMSADPVNPISLSYIPGTVLNRIRLQTSAEIYPDSHVGDEFSLHNSIGVVQGGISGAAFSISGNGSRIDLTTNPALPAGSYTLHLDTASDLTTIIGFCSRWIPEGTLQVALPFTPSQIVALTGGGGSGLYSMSDTTQVKSVRWSAPGCTLIQNGVIQSNPFITQSWAPVDVQMGQSQSTLYAIRNGEGGATDTVSFALMSGLESIEISADELFVTPNPSNSRFVLSSPVAGSYSLWSVYGQVLEAGPAAQEIDLSAYQSGLYLLEIRPDDGRPQLLKLYLRR